MTLGTSNGVLSVSPSIGKNGEEPRRDSDVIERKDGRRSKRKVRFTTTTTVVRVRYKNRAAAHRGSDMMTHNY